MTAGEWVYSVSLVLMALAPLVGGGLLAWAGFGEIRLGKANLQGYLLAFFGIIFLRCGLYPTSYAFDIVRFNVAHWTS
jgi:hypothetical protein